MKVTIPVTVDVTKLKKNLKEAHEENPDTDIFLCIAILDQIERGEIIIPLNGSGFTVNTTDNGYGSNFEREEDAAKKADDSLTLQHKPEEVPTVPLCTTCIRFDRKFPKTCKECKENKYDRYERKEDCKFEF